MTLKTRVRHETTIRDLIQPDAKVICVEGFAPFALSAPVERGRYYRLNDAVVQQFPQYFCVAVPVSDVIGEIER
jgi:hypothetical protein